MKNTNFGKPLSRLITMVTICMLSFHAMAYDFSYTYQGKTLYYNITSDNTIEVTYYSSTTDNNYVSGDVVIPSSVTNNGTTYSVTSIGDYAFYLCIGLTSVTIPNSVTSIADDAFYGCSSLTSVTIPNSVTSIGKWAFISCSGLTSVTIPNSVTSIGNMAFAYCSGLTSVTLPNNATIHSKAFIGAGTKPTIDSVIYRKDTLIVGNYTFIGTGFLTFYLNGNSYFPSNNARVFDCDESKSGDLIIPSTISYNGTTYSVTSIGDRAFLECSGLTSVTIPNSVTSIGNDAFAGCSGLTSVTIPNSVTSIGDGAFSLCSGLTSVTIPNSVTSIGDMAFSSCSGLTSVTIGNSVTSIGDAAFSDCSGLTSVTIPNSVTSIGERAFASCSGLTSITIPNSVTSIGGSAFAGCSSLTSVTIPNSVTSISWSAFAGCSSLTSVTIPNSVTSIDWSAFKSCSSLTSVTIPNSVTSIGGSAFEGCSSLTSVTIPNGVTSIGDDAFAGCSSLTSMTVEMNNIPNLSNIGLNSTLQNLTFEENVASIASGAFNDCSFLQNVTCLATTPPTLEDNTVFPYPNIASLTVPCGTLEDYSSATSFWNMFFAGRISENGYNVEVSVNDETFGSVMVESDCSTGTLTATANEGYVFISWNDGNTDNPRTVALTSDTAFTAIFAAIDESSLSEDVEVAKIGVYPNPTRGKVVFDKAVERVEVIDLVGKTIQTYENASEINIGALPAGVYHLRMSLEDQTITRMVIKE